MEFDEHEEQEGEIGMNNSGARKIAGGGGGGGGGTTGSAGGNSTPTIPTTTYRYRECLKNHAVGIGGNAVDGCGEFLAAGADGTLESLICAACSCHRNFHRREAEGGGEGFYHHHHHHQPPHPPPHHHHPHLATAYSFRSPHPSGYLHVTPPPARPLALPSNSREEEDVSNPSSSGGGDGSKKRFRTRFTPEQKEKMLGFAERLGWRIQKQDEALVQQFCAETNVRRHVLKVWMHNNKHTLGKKP